MEKVMETCTFARPRVGREMSDWMGKRPLYSTVWGDWSWIVSGTVDAKATPKASAGCSEEAEEKPFTEIRNDELYACYRVYEEVWRSTWLVAIHKRVGKDCEVLSGIVEVIALLGYPCSVLHPDVALLCTVPQSHSYPKVRVEGPSNYAKVRIITPTSQLSHIPPKGSG